MADEAESKKCLTRLCEDYTATVHSDDANLTLTDDWGNVKPHITRPPKENASAWSQIIRGGDKVNLFLDLDDRLPTLLMAQKKTFAMVDWAMILSRNIAGNIDTCLNSHLSFSY